MHYNRQQRRSLAKSMGMMDKCSNKEWIARIKRSIQAGIQIDQQFKNQVESKLRNQQVEKEAAMIKADTEAEARITKNRKIQADRAERLYVRSNRQFSNSLLPKN